MSRVLRSAAAGWRQVDRGGGLADPPFDSRYEDPAHARLASSAKPFGTASEFQPVCFVERTVPPGTGVLRRATEAPEPTSRAQHSPATSRPGAGSGIATSRPPGNGRRARSHRSGPSGPERYLGQPTSSAGRPPRKVDRPDPPLEPQPHHHLFEEGDLLVDRVHQGHLQLGRARPAESPAARPRPRNRDVAPLPREDGQRSQWLLHHLAGSVMEGIDRAFHLSSSSTHRPSQPGRPNPLGAPAPPPPPEGLAEALS